MPTWQRVYLAACSAVIGFAFAYAMCEYAGWSRMAYRPLEHSIHLARPPIDKLELGYLGLVAWGAGGALVGAAAALAIGSRLRRPLGELHLRVIGGWALTAAALTGLFETWNLWPF